MKIFTFLTMQLLQRADEALMIERGSRQPDRLKLIWLKRRRKQLAQRLRRSLAAPLLAGV